MSKKVKVNLFSEKSLDEAIKSLQEYKHSFTTSKLDLFVRRLAEAGIPVIDERIQKAQGDSSTEHNVYVRIRAFGSYSEADIVLQGKDIVFFEFGAGVHFNTVAGASPRERSYGERNGVLYEHVGGEEYGFTIGSYGKGLGKNDYWYYTAESGESVKSQGTEATMPMYNAANEIIGKVKAIAKEVYGK